MTFFQKWFSHNPDMFYVVRMGDTTVVAFLIFVPVTESMHNAIMNGKYYDLADFPPAQVCRSMESDWYFMADVAISSRGGFSYLRAASKLFTGMIQLGGQLARYVTSCPITEAGLRLNTSIGMQPAVEVVRDDSVFPIYYMEITEEKRKRVHRFLK